MGAANFDTHSPHEMFGTTLLQRARTLQWPGFGFGPTDADGTPARLFGLLVCPIRMNHNEPILLFAASNGKSGKVPLGALRRVRELGRGGFGRVIEVELPRDAASSIWRSPKTAQRFALKLQLKQDHRQASSEAGERGHCVVKCFIGLEAIILDPQAKIHVKHLHNRPAKAYSKYFKDEEDGSYLFLPGIVQENGKIYKTWKEELVKSAGVTAYMSEYAMHPLQRELRIKKAGIQASVQAMGHTGYRCFLESPEASSMQAAANSGAVPTMEFRGVVVENGVVLRQWRLDPMGDIDEAEEGAENTVGMMEAGMIPNVVDYYDVDTDPTGRFSPGQPFRIHMYSNVAGSKVDTIKQYESIEALPAVFEVPGILQFFNVTRIDGNCTYDRELEKGRATTSDPFQKAELLSKEVRNLSWTQVPG
eukprot:s4067_g5.t1